MSPNLEETLVTFEFEGIEIDQCVETGGIWLDSGELEQIAQLAGVEPGPLSRALKKAKPKGRGDLQCPRCGKKMDLVLVGEKTPVEIDRCPRGHGLWFDPGELKTLVSSFKEGEEGAVAKFFAEMFQSELKVSPEDKDSTH